MTLEDGFVRKLERGKAAGSARPISDASSGNAVPRTAEWNRTKRVYSFD
jgi:hypothetical protein